MEHVRTPIELFWPNCGWRGVDNVKKRMEEAKKGRSGATHARSGAGRGPEAAGLRKLALEGDRDPEKSSVQIALAARDFLAGAEDPLIHQAQVVDLEDPAADADAGKRLRRAL
jgi:hypothetical protein